MYAGDPAALKCPLCNSVQLGASRTQGYEHSAKQLRNVAFRKFRELFGRKKREFENQLSDLKVAGQKCIESIAKKHQNERNCCKKYCRSTREKARRISNGAQKDKEELPEPGRIRQGPLSQPECGALWSVKGSVRQPDI
jgi:hypothetical protein